LGSIQKRQEIFSYLVGFGSNDKKSRRQAGFFYPFFRRIFVSLFSIMTKRGCILIFLLVALMAIMPANDAAAQCSICARTASQLGEKPGKGLNAGIIYLGLSPFLIIGFIGYRWWKSNQRD
jgi:hypothetical protein